MYAWQANAAVGAAVLLAGIAFTLALVGLVAFLRLRTTRLLWVALAMMAQAGQGIYLGILAYAQRSNLASGGEVEFLILPVLNLGVVFALYLAVLKR